MDLRDQFPRLMNTRHGSALRCRTPCEKWWAAGSRVPSSCAECHMPGLPDAMKNFRATQ
jgi:hypothetical protein